MVATWPKPSDGEASTSIPNKMSPAKKLMNPHWQPPACLCIYVPFDVRFPKRSCGTPERKPCFKNCLINGFYRSLLRGAALDSLHYCMAFCGTNALPTASPWKVSSINLLHRGVRPCVE